MKKLILLSFLSVIILTAGAQTADCKVLTDSLKGTYDGGCKNGKADGKGKATGTDIYDGEFKNGLPDGTGKYSWKNGGYYEGEWKKGLKDGKGEMHTIENNEVTVKTGYWKKDKYIGLYETPYKIFNNSSDIGRVEVNNTGKKGQSITVTVKGLLDKTGGSGINTPGNIVVMTDFQIMRGSYTSKSNNKLPNSDVTVFRDVVFPFMAIFSFGASSLQIEFYESGDWDVQVPVSK
jgi:hypothetical protein